MKSIHFSVLKAVRAILNTAKVTPITIKHMSLVFNNHVNKAGANIITEPADVR